jgi:hypothetical protein
MAAILDRHEQPDLAAAEWLKANPTATKAWLTGVTTFDGLPAATTLAHSVPPPQPDGFEQWVVSHKIPVGDAMATVIDKVKTHGMFVFDGVSILIRSMVNGVTTLLRAVPAPFLIAAIAALAYALRRSFTLTAFVALALLWRWRCSSSSIKVIGLPLWRRWRSCWWRRWHRRPSACRWVLPPHIVRGCLPRCVPCST